MAKMKIEVLAARVARHGLSLRDRLVGYLPRYAGLASRFAPLANLRNKSPLLRLLLEKVAGISAKRACLHFGATYFAPRPTQSGRPMAAKSCCLPTPSTAVYERENLDAALRVLVEGGYRVHLPKPADHGRPLCCGRTFLSAGLVDHARAELDRLVSDLRAVRLARRADRRARAELPADTAGRTAVAALRRHSPRTSAHTRCCSRSFWCVKPRPAACDCRSVRSPDKALLHGHCHQKSFGAFKPVEQMLRLVPGLKVETIESSCCGMAGAFGYGADT